jgi:hypothetical protein
MTRSFVSGQFNSAINNRAYIESNDRINELQRMQMEAAITDLTYEGRNILGMFLADNLTAICEPIV